MSEYTTDEPIAGEQAGTPQTTSPRGFPWAVAGVILLVLLFLTAIGFAVFGLLQDADLTSQIRDIFLIFMALESLVIGVALIVLIVQIASLINLLRNEVKPILDSTSEAVNNLRGTTEFLSENLVEPVIKLNGYMASFQRVLELLGIKRK